MNKIWSDEEAKGNSIPWLQSAFHQTKVFAVEGYESYLGNKVFHNQMKHWSREKPVSLSSWALEMRATCST